MTAEQLKAKVLDIISLAQLRSDADCDEVDYEDFSAMLIEKRDELFRDIETLTYSSSLDPYVEVYARIGNSRKALHLTEEQYRHVSLDAVAKRFVELITHTGEMHEKEGQEDKVQG